MIIRNISDLWPCIQPRGLDLFTATADQRYLLGEDLFLRTHHPLTLRRFRAGEVVESVSEIDVFNQLVRKVHNSTGNRVFILYGAAGSGKSEFIRWLQLQIQKTDLERAKSTIRISRTELDILSITERFEHLLSQRYFSEATHSHWEHVRQKPRTLAKLLLLTALERTLDSDELINALYYRLLEWIQPRISRILNAADPGTTMPVEVLTREDLDQLKAETSLPVPLDYEQFRYNLLVAFRENLLEGAYLPATLRLISDDMTKQGRRPLLLIDDLVQSINLFATDILDYFITLETGNWDVVIGLTPDALTGSKRGNELLNRITYLDTVDDRVEKLWLSDMQGNDSYFLSCENCTDFTAKYLDAFRFQNGWQCNTCSHYSLCKGLGTSNNKHNILLAPFNDLLLQRLFKTLPENKGKVRQYMLRLRDVLGGFMQSQELIPVLKQYIRSEMAVEAEDPFIAGLAEYYGPYPKDGQTTLSSNLLNALGVSTPAISLQAQSLRRDRHAPQSLVFNTGVDDDPSRSAIKEWLDGKVVNRQSLLPLRRGIARWLRIIYINSGIYAHGIAAPHQILRFRKVYLGVTPPIILEGVDDGEGINISRSIGLDAFVFQELASAQGDIKDQILLKLAQSERTYIVNFHAIQYKHRLFETLESQLSIGLEKLAFLIQVWDLVCSRDNPKQVIPGLDYEKISEWKQQKPPWLDYSKQEQATLANMFFEDFFKLRDNIFAGPSIAQYMADTSLESMTSLLLQVRTQSIDPDYFIGNRYLGDFLNSIQESVRLWQKAPSENDSSYESKSSFLEAVSKGGRKGILMSQFPTELWEQLKAENPDVFLSLRIRIQ
jgi:hypothetical protein